MSEHDEQVNVIQWAKYREGIYPCLKWLYAVTNGAKLPYSRNSQGQRYSKQAMRLLAEGMRPGISDLCLPYASGAYHGLYLELKYGTNTATDVQIEFANYANNHGYLCIICYGSAEAIAILESYLNLQLGSTLDTVAILDKVHAETPAFLFNKYGGRHCKKVHKV